MSQAPLGMVLLRASILVLVVSPPAVSAAVHLMVMRPLWASLTAPALVIGRVLDHGVLTAIALARISTVRVLIGAGYGALAVFLLQIQISLQFAVPVLGRGGARVRARAQSRSRPRSFIVVSFFVMVRFGFRILFSKVFADVWEVGG